MPSCVVKSCRNHSASEKKSQGITFHKFPATNDTWKNDWTQIIRNCRNDNNWNPTKSSVVCSKHFEEDDLYETKRGLIRVVTFAVPKKFLFEAPTQEELPAVMKNASGSQGSSLVVESAVASGYGQQIKIEPFSSQDEPFPLQQSSLVVKSAVASGYGQQIKIEPYSSQDEPFFSQQRSLVVESAVASGFGQQIKIEQSSSEDEPFLLQQSSLMVESAEASGFGQQIKIEQSSSQDEPFFLQQSSSVVESAEASGSGHQIKIEQSSSQDEPFPLRPIKYVLVPIAQPAAENYRSASQVDIKKENSPTPDTDEEQPMSELILPRKQSMKTQLLKMRLLMQNQQKKIKLLNQKIRRLNARNISLNNILIQHNLIKEHK